MIRTGVVLAALVAFLVTSTFGFGQTTAAKAPAPQQMAKPASPADDPSGMYSFLREGEFVQLTVDDGKVSGFVSRFGATDSDKGQFIDQFFDKASITGDRVTFNTKTVHGIWYEFAGVISITPGKQPGQENYRVIKGTLTQHTGDAEGHEKATQQQVEFKSFPRDLSKP